MTTPTHLTRWHPADLWGNRIQRLFDQAFNDFVAPLGRSGESVDDRAWMPAVDVLETQDTLELQVELPGLEKKDVEIHLENGILGIHGERKFEREDKKEHFHRIERTYGRFQRSFQLPSNVDGSRAEARFNQGVLTIVLPKSDEARARSIEIA